jgi:hypothetical protein
MIRFGKALALIGIGAILCCCSSRHDATRAELRQQPPIKNDVAPETAVARRRIEPAARNDAGDVTNTIGRAGDIRPASEIRPWPKRGTPEWDQLQAEEIAREQRIKDVLSSICRGC